VTKPCTAGEFLSGKQGLAVESLQDTEPVGMGAKSKGNTTTKNKLIELLFLVAVTVR
jgi:hypothetical protein